MPSPRGIFRLKQVYEEQLSDNWSVKPDVWLSPSPYFGSWEYGYFGGGTNPVSTVDRIDYSNDTVTAPAKGPLSTPVYGNSGFSPVANGL